MTDEHIVDLAIAIMVILGIVIIVVKRECFPEMTNHTPAYQCHGLSHPPKP